jgi:hypothetical protein
VGGAAVGALRVQMDWRQWFIPKNAPLPWPACFWRRSLTSSLPRAPPNPSLERTSTGKALGPRGAQAYHAPRGPSALPVASAQLKR